MSDIFNPTELPDPTSVVCPECGAIVGKSCAYPPDTWNHGTRIWIAVSIMAIKELKQPESTEPALKDSYAEGWNDAIDAICERLYRRS